MAFDSTFVRLSSSILLEYRYTDQNNPEIINTNQAPIYVMENEFDGTKLFFNEDGSEDVTGNVRDRSAALIDESQSRYALLNIDRIRAYNDTVDKLTNSQNLSVSFNNTQGIEYDTVRLHLVRGFNFEGNEGFFFGINVRDDSDNIVKLLSLSYTFRDNYESLNPDPFLFAGKHYTTYIEVKIPSVRSLIDEYKTEYLLNNNTDILSYKLTDGKGFKATTLIETELGFFDDINKINAQEYFNILSKDDVSLNQQDQFSNISAVVRDSDDGDYLELTGKYKGDSIENFIDTYNNQPKNDYIIIHRVQLNEQVGNQWFITQDIEIAQDSDFDRPIKYRPVIENTKDAVAWKIDYTMRLYNRYDNTQIWKLASYISRDVFKYGKKLQKIDLEENPVQVDIFNKIESKTFDLDGSFGVNSSFQLGDGSTGSETVIDFIEVEKVNVSSNNLRVQQQNGQQVLVDQPILSSDITQLKGQGEGIIVVNPYNTYVKFIIYEKNDDGGVNAIDLNELGKLFINFASNQGEPIKIEELVTGNASKNAGEVIFKIPKEKAEKITGLSDRSFSITTFNATGENSIYTGQFITSSELSERTINDIITEQREKIQELESKISELETQNQAKTDLVEEKNDQIQTLQGRIEVFKQELESEIASAQDNLQQANENKTAKEIGDKIKGLKELKDIEVKAPSKTLNPKEIDLNKLSKNVKNSKSLK